MSFCPLYVRTVTLIFTPKDIYIYTCIYVYMYVFLCVLLFFASIYVLLYNFIIFWVKMVSMSDSSNRLCAMESGRCLFLVWRSPPSLWPCWFPGAPRLPPFGLFFSLCAHATVLRLFLSFWEFNIIVIFDFRRYKPKFLMAQLSWSSWIAIYTPREKNDDDDDSTRKGCQGDWCNNVPKLPFLQYVVGNVLG